MMSWTAFLFSSLLVFATASAQPDTLWTRRFDACTHATAVVQTSEGNMVVAGQQGDNACLVKLTMDGELVWQQTLLADADVRFHRISSLAPIGKGGVITVGSWSSEGPVLLHVDSDGLIQWQKRIPNPDPGRYSSLRIDEIVPAGAGFLLAGNTSANYDVSVDAYLARIDAEGNLLWTRTMNGSGAESYVALAPMGEEDGLAVGVSHGVVQGTALGDGAMFATRVQAGGDVMWSHGLDGFLCGLCYYWLNEAADVIAGPDSHFVVVANHALPGPPGSKSVFEAFLIRLDEDGEVGWVRTFSQETQESPSQSTFATAAANAPYGSSFVTGNVYEAPNDNGRRDGFLAQFDAAGELLGAQFVGRSDRDERIRAMTVAADGRIVLVGTQAPQGTLAPVDARDNGNGAMYVVALPYDVITTNEKPSPPVSGPTIHNAPNPFRSRTNITFTLTRPASHAMITVYDLLGREVTRLVEAPLPMGQHRITFEANDLPSGVYLYRLRAGEQLESNTMVLQR